MKVIVLSLLVSMTAFGQESKICLDEVEARNVASYIKRTEAENEALKAEIKAGPSPVLLITISAALGLILGGSVAYGVTKATQSKN